MSERTAHTQVPWRLHDMERATIVAGKPGGEVANCLNGFGDQDANARFIIRACNTHAGLLAALNAIRSVPYDPNDTGQESFSLMQDLADAAIAKVRDC